MTAFRQAVSSLLAWSLIACEPKPEPRSETRPEPGCPLVRIVDGKAIVDTCYDGPPPKSVAEKRCFDRRVRACRPGETRWPMRW